MVPHFSALFSGQPAGKAVLAQAVKPESGISPSAPTCSGSGSLINLGSAGNTSCRLFDLQDDAQLGDAHESMVVALLAHTEHPADMVPMPEQRSAVDLHLEPFQVKPPFERLIDRLDGLAQRLEQPRARPLGLAPAGPVAAGSASKIPSRV